MTITVSNSTEVGGKKTEKTVTVILPDDTFEKAKQHGEDEVTLQDFVRSLSDSIK